MLSLDVVSRPLAFVPCKTTLGFSLRELAGFTTDRMETIQIPCENGNIGRMSAGGRAYRQGCFRSAIIVGCENRAKAEVGFVEAPIEVPRCDIQYCVSYFSCRSPSDVGHEPQLTRSRTTRRVRIPHHQGLIPQSYRIGAQKVRPRITDPTKVRPS